MDDLNWCRRGILKAGLDKQEQPHENTSERKTFGVTVVKRE